MEMKKIVKQDVQKILTTYENTPVYLHVEITSGMYASHLDGNVFNAGTFRRQSAAGTVRKNTVSD
jgi:hypothetical protein